MKNKTPIETAIDAAIKGAQLDVHQQSIAHLDAIMKRLEKLKIEITLLYQK